MEFPSKQLPFLARFSAKTKKVNIWNVTTLHPRWLSPIGRRGRQFVKFYDWHPTRSASVTFRNLVVGDLITILHHCVVMYSMYWILIESLEWHSRYRLSSKLTFIIYINVALLHFLKGTLCNNNIVALEMYLVVSFNLRHPKTTLIQCRQSTSRLRDFDSLFNV